MSDWVEPQGKLLPVQVYAGGRDSEVAVVALGLEDCGAAMDPSSGGRVGAEPTKETWLECGEDPVAVGCGRAVVDGKGGGAGAKAVEDADADGGTKCASTRAAACCAAC